jgi:hypothetical protein
MQDGTAIRSLKSFHRKINSSPISQADAFPLEQVFNLIEPSDDAPSPRTNGINNQTISRREKLENYHPIKTVNIPPRSRTEDSDDLSEESHYSEASSAIRRKSFSWSSNANHRSTVETQKSKREGPLLSGLGLGLTNVDIAHVLKEKHLVDESTHEIIHDLHNKDPKLRFNPKADVPEIGDGFCESLTQGASPTDVSLPHALSPNREVTSSKTPIDFSSEYVRNLGRLTPKPGYLVYQERSKSPARSDEIHSLGNTVGYDREIPITPVFDEVTQRNHQSVIEKNTQSASPISHLGSHGLNNHRKDSDAIAWSGCDSIEEGFSQDAQKMFSRLQGSATLNERHSSRNGHDQNNIAPRQDLSLLSDAKPSGRDSRRQHTGSNESGADPAVPKTWRGNLSSSAYQSLLEKHGITEMKRQDIIFELCETEAAFVKSMKFVISNFLAPLKSQGKLSVSLSY